MKVFLAGALCLMASCATAATTLYTERFGRDGKGASGTAFDLTNVDWTLDLGDASLFDEDDFALVRNGVFVFNDTNAGCAISSCLSNVSKPVPDIPTWFSPVIDLAGYASVSLSLTYSGSGRFEAVGGIGVEDDFIVSLILDGTEVTVFDYLEEVGEGARSARLLTPFLNATGTAQIAVAGNTYVSNEVFTFDNVILQGELEPVVEEETETGGETGGTGGTEGGGTGGGGGGSGEGGMSVPLPASGPLLAFGLALALRARGAPRRDS